MGSRRAGARPNEKGEMRGLGVALFLEPSGGTGKEQVEIRVAPDGHLAMYSLAGPSGQGHETAFPQLVANILGLPEESIELRYNDDAAPKLIGVGSFGSRSLISHGSAFATAAKESWKRAASLPPENSKLRPDDVVFDKGEYRVVGTDLAVGIKVLIEKKWRQAVHPLDTNVTIDLATAFPSGAHVAEVEIDPETGALEIVNYIAADDCGTMFSEKLVEGQLHGGMMQGFGQVLGEHIVYDPDSGQLLSGSFMDYFMPRAENAVPTQLIDCGVPSPANLLGAKGAGEAGATGSIPALANAVLDALKPLKSDTLRCPTRRHVFGTPYTNDLKASNSPLQMISGGSPAGPSPQGIQSRRPAPRRHIAPAIIARTSEKTACCKAVALATNETGQPFGSLAFG